MGWNIKPPKIKIGNGLYVNLNKDSVSITAKGKHVTTTTNLKTGSTKATVKTPIKGVSYTTTFNKDNTKKK